MIHMLHPLQLYTENRHIYLYTSKKLCSVGETCKATTRSTVFVLASLRVSVSDVQRFGFPKIEHRLPLQSCSVISEKAGMGVAYQDYKGSPVNGYAYQESPLTIMNAVGRKRHILLSGKPGAGKTTMVKKVCQELTKRGIPLKGFFTEEVRVSGRRVGFDIVSMDGTRSPLARICHGAENQKTPKVGQYIVDVHSFESVALPNLTSGGMKEAVIVIDEIGKMELFSKSFEKAVKDLFRSEAVIFGTLPLLKGTSHSLVHHLHHDPTVEVIMVDLMNRDELMPDVLHHLLSTVCTKL